jgi:hypothetical protein
MKDDPDVPPVRDHKRKLEHALVEAYLREHGDTLRDMESLPVEARSQLLRDASMRPGAWRKSRRGRATRRKFIRCVD